MNICTLLKPISRQTFVIVILLLMTTCDKIRSQSNPIDSLIEITATASDDSLVNVAYRAIMLYYIQNTKTDSALYWGDLLIDYGKEHNYRQAGITANYYKAYYNYRQGNYPEVIKLSKNVAQLSRAEGKTNTTIDALVRIADTYNQMGEQDSSQYYLDQAEALSKDYKDDELLSLVLISKGNFYQSGDLYDQAAASFLKVDSIQRIVEAPNHYRHGVARHNIGLIYYQQLDRPEEALTYAELAVESYEADGRRSISSLNSLNIFLSRIYLSSGQLDKADSLINTAVAYYQQGGLRKKLAEAYVVQSNVNIEKGNFSAAERASNEALKIFTDINQPNEISTTLSQLGKLYKTQGDYNKSIDYLKKSMTYEVPPTVILSSLQLLAETQKLKGDYKSAYETLAKHNVQKDSLDDVALDSRFAEYEVKYESLEKERIISKLEIDKIRTQAINHRNRLLGALLLSGLAGIALFFWQSNQQKKKINNTLKEVDQLKSRFFSNISHELRTPLALIKGPVDTLLKSNEIKGSDKQQLSIVQRNTKRLTRLVNDLLELSRIEAGTRQLKVQAMIADDHLRTIFSNFESAAISNGQEYIYNVQGASEAIYYEPQIIDTVIYNLISNALKYSPSGALIEARASIEETHLIIAVNNTGQTIEPAEMSRIFDRFYRIEDNSGNIEGVGVGLALVKELVNTHKGTIEVSSTDEGGTSFEVKIPVAQDAYRDEERSSISFVPTAASELSIHVDEDNVELLDDAPVLLIVEDNPDMQSFLKSSFGSKYQIRVASNGQEGLQIAKEIIPDIIISDMMMPVMDGATMCAEIKKNIALSHIPVIVLTAKAEEDTKLSTLEIGVDDYIAKPFSIDEITIKVKNLLQIRKALQERYATADYVEKRELAKSPTDQAFWNQIETVLAAHLTDETYSIETFAENMSMSRMQLHRKLKALTGKSASTFLRSERLKKAKELMQTQKLRVSEVAYECGFSSPFYFSKCFKEEFGISPKEFYEQIIGT